MRTTAGKSSSHSPTVTRVQRFFPPSRATATARIARKARPEGLVQAKLAVSKPADPLEQEADRTAERVMQMPVEAVRRPDPAGVVPPVQRAASAERTLQRSGRGARGAVAEAQSSIVAAASGGEALTPGVRAFMEPRLGAELGDVRVHADEGAHSLSNHLSARAFTYRNHVFFGRGEYQPGTQGGRRLLAHELAHTVQQGATVLRAPAPALQRAAAAAPPMVQRLGFDDVLEHFAGMAAHVPGFRMLTLVLGFNPITMASVPRSPANFLRALIEIVPGGAIVTRALDSHGVINDAADWVEQKVAALGDLGSMLSGAVSRFIDGLGLTDLADPAGVWDRAKRIVTDPIARLVAFGTGVVRELLALVKRAILRPLAAMAQGTAGYDLLKAVLGEDPITGDPVPQDAETLIGGFMKLIGQEEVWQNIKQGNAAPRAFAWFKGALAGLLGFVRSIPQRIVQTIASLTFEDVVTIVGAFRKVGSAFAGMVGQFFSWAGQQVISLLEILVSVVAPGVLPYIAKARAAFRTIVRNPVAFVSNLVRAGRLGFERFARNIATHLKTALIKWITGPLGEAGVYIPQAFTLVEIVKLVLSVLGLTWQNIRAKLVKIIPEPILVGLEKTASVLVTLVTQGPAAAWEQIKGELAELKDQLVGQVTQMVTTEIVKAAVVKLVSMLNPAGAVIQAIVAIYSTIMFFVEKAKQIGAVIASFIDSIAAIAAGQVEGAAKRVEATLASTLTVVLAFLARFAGLGGIPGKVVGIITKIRAPIDRGLDRIVAWLGKMLDKLVAKAKAAARKLLEWWKKKVPIRGGSKPHTLTFEGEKGSAKLVVRSDPFPPAVFLKDTAKRASIADSVSSGPIGIASGHADNIRTLQGQLKKYDDNPDAAAAGAAAADANEKSSALDAAMSILGAHIGTTLGSWSVADEDVEGVSLPREVVTIDATGKKKTKQMAKWSKTAKQAIKGEHERMGGDPKLLDAEGSITDPKAYARRHVVSLKDIGDHYEQALNGKKASKGKLLLEERGSVGDAKTIVDAPFDAAAVTKAALKRWRKFFGYAKNIFLGDSRENSSIQEHLDTGHPEMADAKLWEHVDRIKRGWAIDSSIAITPPRKAS